MFASTRLADTSALNAGERSSVMWFRKGAPYRTRPTVAQAVETVVAMGLTVAVTVFFVAMVVFPNAMHAAA